MNMLKTLSAAGLLLAASAASAVTTVDIEYKTTSGVEFWATGNNGVAGALNFTVAGSSQSFAAFCIELSQDVARDGLARTYTATSFGADAQGVMLQKLFSSSYAGVTTDLHKAAFQAAVWEITHETGGALDAGAGVGFQVNFLSPTSDLQDDADFINLTNSYLTAAQGYTGSAKYTLTRLSNDTFQNLVVASAVPEPESYALFLAGLGAIGLIARRRLPR